MTTEQGTTRVVLVVDDNDADRAIVRRLLGAQRRRYELVEAATGAEGLARFTERAPDCVLLDYHLPDMDGTEFMRRLAGNRPAGVPVPVAVMSGVEDDAAAVAALHAGAQDYVPKEGITGPHLARVLENTVEKYRIRRELEEQRAAVEMRNHRLELLRDELQARMLELNDATRAKDRFLAVMSHEMRTPLNAILGYTDLLDLELDGTLNDGQRQHLDRMRVGSRHLLDLINDVLDITRADARKLEVDMRAVDLGAVIEEVAGLMEGRARSQGLQLVIDPIPADLPHVQADLQRLRQVLTNLVGNAIKFTDEGSVRVRCAPGLEEGTVVVEVADTGIGVDPDVLPLLFTEFYQAKDELTRRHGGSGLGLAISQRLATLMGGSITASSRKGEGSTFTLHLRAAGADSPLRADDVEQHGQRMAAHAMSRDAASTARPAGPVSVVGFADDATALGDLALRVSPGVRLSWTTDPSRVAELAAREQATLVLLDASSAGGAAWRAAMGMSEDPKLSSTAVLLVPSLSTALSSPSAAELNLGWVSVVPKPFTAVQLNSAVAAASGTSTTSGTGANGLPVFEDRCDVLVVDDDADSRRVALRFLKEARAEVREAADGESALLAMRARVPAVVVLDLMMPVLDGFGVLAAMRADPLLVDIPVIVLTAKSLTEAERQFLSRTALRVLQKGAHRLADVAALVLRAAPQTRRSGASTAAGDRSADDAEG